MRMDSYWRVDSTMATLNEITVVKASKLYKTDIVKRFLLEMLLTHAWSDEFQHTLIETDDESTSLHISDYVFKIGLLKLSDEGDYKYDISVKGRKYLEKQNVSL